MNTGPCLDSLKQRAALHSKYPDAWYNLGALLAHLERPEEALAAVDRALEAHPTYIDALVSRAFLLAELGRAPEAFRDFDRIHVRSPDDFTTVHAMGVFCLRNGWRDIGLEVMRRAERMRPRVPYVILHLAAAYLETGDTSSAQRMQLKARAILEDQGLERLTSGVSIDLDELEPHGRWVDPFRPRAHVILATCWTGEGDTAGAERELLEAARRWPGHPLIFWQMGRLLAAEGKRAEALRWLTALARMDDDCPQAHSELSFLYAESQDLTQAVESLRTAVALRPFFPDYHYHLGTLLMDMGRTDEAIAELKRVELLHPAFGHTPIYLASAYLAKDDGEAALAALESSPCAGWTEGLLLAAQAHLKTGQKSKARALLERALAVDPSNHEARALLGSAQEIVPAK